MNDKELLDKILTQIALPDSQWVLIGSSALVLRDIEIGRSIGDVDIILATRPWFDLLHDPAWRLVTTNPDDIIKRNDPPYLSRIVEGRVVDIFPSYKNRTPYDFFDVASLIRNAEIIHGWPCAPLVPLRDFKIGRAGERSSSKDLHDAKLIDEYLSRA